MIEPWFPLSEQKSSEQSSMHSNAPYAFPLSEGLLKSTHPTWKFTSWRLTEMRDWSLSMCFRTPFPPCPSDLSILQTWPCYSISPSCHPYSLSFILSFFKILSQALLSCHKASGEAGQPFSLEVFISGRNRLENPGAKELANAFKVRKN